jgi:hypothetical protein
MIPRIFVCILLALVALARAAHAHAELDRANPLVGSTVASAPRVVSLTFSQNLERAFSSGRVENASGVRVDQGKAQIGQNVMRIALKPLPPGTYRVFWKVLSVDTHTTEGNFSFTVGR